jgi:hypothetical protein
MAALNLAQPLIVDLGEEGLDPSAPKKSHLPNLSCSSASVASLGILLFVG